jgi:hypothetical protein
MNFPVKNNMASAETYDKCLEIIREQFRIIESMSAGNRASWYQEVEHLLNLAKADLENTST